MIVSREAATVHAGDDENVRVGLGDGFPAHGRPFFVGFDDVAHSQHGQHVVRDAFATSNIRVDFKVGAGEPEHRRQLVGAIGAGLFLGGGNASLVAVHQIFATVLHVEDLRELFHALVHTGDVEGFKAGAICADQVVLAFAVRRQDVGRDVHIVELFAGADHALWADHPFELHRNQLGTLAEHGFKARVVVGEALDLGILLGVFRRH